MKTPVFLLACLLSAPSWAASCKIAEYANLAVDEGGRVVPVALEPSLAVQSVTYTTNVASSAFNARTRFIRVICDAKAHFEFGTAPTATATDPYIATDSAEYFAVPRNGSYKVAFYDGSSL